MRKCKKKTEKTNLVDTTCLSLAPCSGAAGAAARDARFGEMAAALSVSTEAAVVCNRTEFTTEFRILIK